MGFVRLEHPSNPYLYYDYNIDDNFAYNFGKNEMHYELGTINYFSHKIYFFKL